MYSVELEEDCWVVVDRGGLGVRLVNTVAVFIAELAEQGLDTAAIVAQLMERYEVDEQTAHNDVLELLDSWHGDQSISLKEHEPYQPLTQFVPNRACEPVATYEAYLPGFCFRFASELPELRDYISELFALPDVTDEPRKTAQIDIYKDGDQYPIVFEGRTLDTGLTVSDTAIKCLREVNGIIGRDIPYTIIFHASAVALNGRAVLFPAAGGSGKTTLAAFLMSQGYEFLNDDAVPLCSESALLQPAPLSLSIKQGSWKVLDRWFESLKSSRVYGQQPRKVRYLAPLKDAICRQPIECTMIVLPDYSAEATELRCEAVSSKQAFEHILKSGCILDQPVDPVQISALVDWLRPLPVFKLNYRDMHDVELWLRSRLS